MQNGYLQNLHLDLPETDLGCPLDQFRLAAGTEDRLSASGWVKIANPSK